MALKEMSVEELVKAVRDNKIRLPEIQRGYVWKSTQVRDLIDSLYRGYPAGNILMWETTDENTPTRDMAIGQKGEKHYTYLLLLDGQQRITSLARLIDGDGVTVRDKRQPIDIYFNIDHPENYSIASSDYDKENEAEIETESGGNGDEETDEEQDFEQEENIGLKAMKERTFVVANKRLKNEKEWVSVKEVFNSDGNTHFLEKLGIVNLKDPRFKKYDERLNKLRNIKKYIFHITSLKNDMDYEEITEVFVRVNSLGTKLKGSDLALAQITTKWKGSLEKFEQYRDNLHSGGWNIPLGIIARALITIITGQSKFHTVSSISKERLENGWEKTERAISFALDFLKNNSNISAVSLISPYFIVLVAYFVHTKNYEISPSEANALSKWLFIANAKGRYSGSSESMLDQDLKSKTIQDMLSVLKVQFGKLDIDDEEIAGKWKNSGYFKNMFIAMQKMGAKDWKTNLQISIKHLNNRDKIEFHHIFPKDFLKSRYERNKINDIANITFIGKVSNIKISNKDPEKYLPEILEKCGEDMLKKHCIPLDKDLWKLDRYEDFLTARRKLIINMFNDYLNMLS